MAALLIALIATLLALVLVSSGLGKVVDAPLFVGELLQLGVFGETGSHAIGRFLPWFELTTGTALMHAQWRAAGLALATTLFAGFATFAIVAGANGWSASCSCFGAIPIGFGGLTWATHAIIVGLSAMTAGRTLWWLRRRATDPAGHPRP